MGFGEIRAATFWIALRIGIVQTLSLLDAGFMVEEFDHNLGEFFDRNFWTISSNIEWFGVVFRKQDTQETDNRIADITKSPGLVSSP